MIVHFDNPKGTLFHVGWHGDVVIPNDSTGKNCVTVNYVLYDSNSWQRTHNNLPQTRRGFQKLLLGITSV